MSGAAARTGRVKKKKRRKYSKIAGRGSVENKNGDHNVRRRDRIVYMYEK